MAIKKYIDDTPVDNDNYVVVATKISKPFFKRLSHICRCKCLTIYSFIQIATETIVRYCDDKHNLSPEIEEAMTVFEHLDGWKDAYNLADPNTNTIQVEEAIYVLSKENKRGMRAVLVGKPYFGEWEQTDNPKQIVERTLAVTTPELYRRMRRIGVDMECESIVETMIKMVDIHSDEDDVRELRKPFEDSNRDSYGRKPHEGAPFRRKMTKSIESPEFDFTPFDVEP